GESVWPDARFRRARNVDVHGQVASAPRETPESAACLKLLEAALGESEDGAVWDAAVPEPAAERPVKAPVLSHAHITLNGRAARRWLRQLLTLALPQQVRRIDGIALLEAALRYDDAGLDALAQAAVADP